MPVAQAVPAAQSRRPDGRAGPGCEPARSRLTPRGPPHRRYRPPPPPPPPPPPENPPPPPPEELPGGVDEDAICALRALPIELVKRPMSLLPLPWYHAMPAVAAAAAAVPTAAVNLPVQAFSTPSATAYGSSASKRAASSGGGACAAGPCRRARSSCSATER